MNKILLTIIALFVVSCTSLAKRYETDFGMSLGSISFSSNGRYIAIGSGGCNLFEVESGKKILRYETDFGMAVGSIAFSSNGKYIAIGSGGCNLFEVESGNKK